jgi:dTDP-4-amino-4,6-dideoxygalactose transaminase
MKKRIYLSPPHMGGDEWKLLQDAFASNWIAPLGPHVDAFEAEFCRFTGAPHALATSSGTGALHLALQVLGVSAGDEVAVSSLTFAGSVNPILYLGARPVFIDSERESWNLDPALFADWLKQRAAQNRLPKALVLVHLYGQSAHMEPILQLCRQYDILLIEDAAEALGATWQGTAVGTLGDAGIFSFNGNKIITTSGGGMLISPRESLIKHAYKLATQAREPFPHYEHHEVGYNYRLSNLLAAVGRGQLRVLPERVAARRAVFDAYREQLGDLPGLSFTPEAPWGRANRWLTTLTVDPDRFGADREAIRLALEAENIEARPVWKPMHLQPAYAEYESVGGEVAADLFNRGLCLPSGSDLTPDDQRRIINIVREVAFS